MRNQFIYTEEVTMPAAKGVEPEVQIRKNSFNVDYVLRAIQMDGGGLLLLLDDLHERWQDVPSMTKNGKKMIKREKDTFQSEIRLSKEEGERFFKISEITETND